MDHPPKLMRIFAISDVHVDYDVNLKWVHSLSQFDHRDDLLILAGDVSHKQALLAECLSALTRRFRAVLFVPGNHDLWVLGEDAQRSSLQKFDEVAATVEACGASMAPQQFGGTLLIPLQGWYDYSFGEPSDRLQDLWMDFRACRWPAGWKAADVARHFERMNPVDRPQPLSVSGDAAASEPITKVITFSHFLPRIDLVPAYVPAKYRVLDPVLGSTRLDDQLRRFQPHVHVYGHSHINRSLRIEGVTYINNALGYPQEERIASRLLVQINPLQSAPFGVDRSGPRKPG